MTLPGTRNSGPRLDRAAIEVKFSSIDNQLEQFRDSVLGLDGKIDRAVVALSGEFRAAISTLSTQISERQRTPWVTLISAAAFMVTVLGLFGSQELAPVLAELKRHDEQIVPRAEVEQRRAAVEYNLATLSETMKRAGDRLQTRMDRLQQSFDLQQQNRIDSLERELRDLHRQPPSMAPR